MQKEKKIHMWKNNHSGKSSVVNFGVEKGDNNCKPHSDLPSPTFFYLCMACKQDSNILNHLETNATQSFQISK